MTFDAGRISTWRFPRFSAVKMLRRQSLSTFTLTMVLRRECRQRQRLRRQGSLGASGDLNLMGPLSVASWQNAGPCTCCGTMLAFRFRVRCGALLLV